MKLLILILVVLTIFNFSIAAQACYVTPEPTITPIPTIIPTPEPELTPEPIPEITPTTEITIIPEPTKYNNLPKTSETNPMKFILLGFSFIVFGLLSLCLVIKKSP